MNPIRFMLAIVIALSIIAPAAAQEDDTALTVYLVRHAETVGNVTGDYSGDNQRIFSELGERQRRRLPSKLRDYNFDAILCSPTWRTRQTILPYLKKYNRTAEIWPEIEECCCGNRGGSRPADQITQGEKIDIPLEQEPYFKLRDENSTHRFAPANEEEELAQIQRGCDMIRDRFGGTGQSILLVSHSCTGSRLMENLLGVKMAGRFSPGNAALTELVEEEGGPFRLVTFNDEPFEQRYYWTFYEDARPEAGKDLVMSLIPKYLAQQNAAGYRLDWRLRDQQRQFVGDGSELFSPDTIGEQPLIHLTLPTSGSKRGELWRLYTSMYAGADRIQQWTFDILFPAYLELGGTWKTREGDDPAWAAVEADETGWLETDVPGAWEDDALPDYDGIAWYRKHFTIPSDYIAAWGTNQLAIVFGAIDDADVTYLNGNEIGRSGVFPPAEITAYDQPRVYPVSEDDLLQTNVIAVRISDWGGAGGIWRGPVAVGPVKDIKQALEMGIR